jgi:hypothetical protein
VIRWACHLIGNVHRSLFSRLLVRLLRHGERSTRAVWRRGRRFYSPDHRATAHVELREEAGVHPFIALWVSWCPGAGSGLVTAVAASLSPLSPASSSLPPPPPSPQPGALARVLKQEVDELLQEFVGVHGEWRVVCPKCMEADGSGACPVSEGSSGTSDGDAPLPAAWQRKDGGFSFALLEQSPRQHEACEGGAEHECVVRELLSQQVPAIRSRKAKKAPAKKDESSRVLSKAHAMQEKAESTTDTVEALADAADVLLGVLSCIPGLGGVCEQAQRIVSTVRGLNGIVSDVLEVTAMIVEVMDYMKRLADAAKQFSAATKVCIEMKLRKLAGLLAEVDQAIAEYKSTRFKFGKVFRKMRAGAALTKQLVMLKSNIRNVLASIQQDVLLETSISVHTTEMPQLLLTERCYGEQDEEEEGHTSTDEEAEEDEEDADEKEEGKEEEE